MAQQRIFEVIELAASSQIVTNLANPGHRVNSSVTLPNPTPGGEPDSLIAHYVRRDEHNGLT